MGCHPCLEPAAPIDKRHVANIFLAIEQHVIDPHESRIVSDMGFCRRLAVQPLLQVIEIHRVEVVADQQFTIKHGAPVKRLDKVGEGGADIIAGAREQSGAFAVDDKLHANPVPFPLGLIIIRRQPVEIPSLVDRVRQHHRMESLAVADFRARSGAVEPCKKLGVGDVQPMPDLFDLGEVMTAIGCQCSLCQTRRHADPQPARGELDHGPAFGRACLVQQRGNMAG